MMRSVEVGIQRSAEGQTRVHREPAGAGTDADAASAAVAAADACLTSSAAIPVLILVVVATARRMQQRGASERVPPAPALLGRLVVVTSAIVLGAGAVDGLGGWVAGRDRAGSGRVLWERRPRRPRVVVWVCGSLILVTSGLALAWPGAQARRGATSRPGV